MVLFDGNKPPQLAIVVEIKFNTSSYGTRKVKYTAPGTLTVKQCTKEYYDETLEVMAHAADTDVNDCATKLKALGKTKVLYIALRVEGDPNSAQFNPTPQWEKAVDL